MGLIPCMHLQSQWSLVSCNPNWQKQKSWAGFQSESVQACSLPADQTGSQVALHQCDGFIWLRNLINFYIALCSHISTEVFRMVQIFNKVNPNALLLSDVWSLQAGSLPADQAKANTHHVTPHQYAVGFSSCGHFMNFFRALWLVQNALCALPI